MALTKVTSGVLDTLTGLTISAATPSIQLTDSDNNADAFIQGTDGNLKFFADDSQEASSSEITFAVDGTERMKINSSGEVAIGATAASPFLLNVGSTGNDSYRPVALSVGSTAGRTQISFNNANGAVGSIVSNGSATSYGTSSDYRLKENVVTNWDATTRLKQLKPSRFNFIADADTTVDGFLAHEVSDIVPEAVIGEKDATKTYTDDDGNEQTKPVYQGIDQSKLVPLLVKTIQELEARITTLENA